MVEKQRLWFVRWDAGEKGESYEDIVLRCVEVLILLVERRASVNIRGMDVEILTMSVG